MNRFTPPCRCLHKIKRFASLSRCLRKPKRFAPPCICLHKPKSFFPSCRWLHIPKKFVPPCRCMWKPKMFRPRCRLIQRAHARLVTGPVRGQGVNLGSISQWASFAWTPGVHVYLAPPCGGFGNPFSLAFFFWYSLFVCTARLISNPPYYLCEPNNKYKSIALCIFWVSGKMVKKREILGQRDSLWSGICLWNSLAIAEGEVSRPQLLQPSAMKCSHPSGLAYRISGHLHSQQGVMSMNKGEPKSDFSERLFLN
jgi:hypothetical protein